MGLGEELAVDLAEGVFVAADLGLEVEPLVAALDAEAGFGDFGGVGADVGLALAVGAVVGAGDVDVGAVEGGFVEAEAEVFGVAAVAGFPEFEGWVVEVVHAGFGDEVGALVEDDDFGPGVFGAAEEDGGVGLDGG